LDNKVSENKGYSAFVGTVQYFTFLAAVCILWNKIICGCRVITTSNKSGYKKVVWALLSVGILYCMYVMYCAATVLAFKIWLLW